AKWKIPIDIPNLSYVDNVVIDSLGNADGRADPGEDVEMIVTLENDSIFHDATNIAGTLTCDEGDVSITHGTVGFPDMPAGFVGDNSSDPFKFSVDALAEPHRAYFDLHVTADPGGYAMDHRFRLMLGRPDVLLVDDDHGSVYEMFFEPVLDSIRVVYDKWDVENDLDSPDLSLYHCIIWFTGDDSLTSLTSQEQTDVASFLDDGGGLILTGQNVGQDISGEPFYSDYLQAILVRPSTGDHIIDGETGDPIGDGISLISAGSGGAGNQTSQDVIEPTGGASAVFRYSPDSVAAIRYDSGTYRVVYYAFGLEALSRISTYSGRDTVLARSLEWVGCPIPVGLEEQAVRMEPVTDRMVLRCFPTPFMGSVGISATVSAGNGGVSISVHDLAGRLVKCLLKAGNTDRHPPIATEWDGRDYRGQELPSGIYFIRLTSGVTSRTEKIVLLR
ncbi:MAG: T9SS type A sorting domain-containing protein, partial [bacterium]